MKLGVNIHSKSLASISERKDQVPLFIKVMGVVIFLSGVFYLVLTRTIKKVEIKTNP